MSHPAHFDPATGNDRRSGDARHRLCLHSGLIDTQGATVDVRILNISTTGLLLETTRELAAGDRLQLELPGHSHCAAEVVWNDGRMHGCRFMAPLSKAALSAAKLKAATKPSRMRRSVTGVGETASSPEESIGARIARLRKKQGLTLDQLAAATQVSRTSIWKWEQDQVRPRRQTGARLAMALGITLPELLYGETQASRPASSAALPAEGSQTLEQLVNSCKHAIAAAAETQPENISISIKL